MKIHVLTARVHTHTTEIEIAIYQDDQTTLLGTESFTYGLDVPATKIRDNILALLGNRYEPDPDTVMPIEGQWFDVP